MRKAILGNFFGEILVKAINLISIFLINILLANYLGPKSFGSFSFILALSSGFLILSEFGLERIEIRETALGKKIVESSLLIRFFSTTISYLILVLLVGFLDPVFSLKKHIIVFSISTFSSISYTIRNFFIGHLKNYYSASALAAKDLASLLAIFLLIKYNASLFEILKTYMLLYFVEAAILILLFKLKFSSYKIMITIDTNQVKYLIRRSFPIFIAGFLIFIYKRLDIIIINFYLDDFSAGLYGSAQKLSTALLTSTMIIMMVYGTVLNRSIKTNEYNRKRLLFLELIIGSSLILSSLFFVFSKDLIHVLYDDSFIGSLTSFRVLLIKNVFESIFLATGYIIIIQDLQNKAYVRSLVTAAFSLCSNLLFLPIYGIVASAIISLLSFFIAGFVSNYMVKSYVFLNKLTIHAFHFTETKLLFRQLWLKK